MIHYRCSCQICRDLECYWPFEGAVNRHWDSLAHIEMCFHLSPLQMIDSIIFWRISGYFSCKDFGLIFAVKFVPFLAVFVSLLSWFTVFLIVDTVQTSSPIDCIMWKNIKTLDPSWFEKCNQLWIEMICYGRNKWFFHWPLCMLFRFP